jgi:hypothetical protein
MKKITKVMMMRLVFTFLFLLGTVAAQDRPAATPGTVVPEIDAEMGDCTADFRVTDTKQQPLYNAKLSTQIKHGFGGFRKLDLEVSTNQDGQARFVGLPPKPREPLAVHADYDGRGTVVIVSPIQKCHGSYNAIVTDRPVKTDKDEESEEAKK